jgi:peptidoglycan/LPS O-acetylase OafA/YrhL
MAASQVVDQAHSRGVAIPQWLPATLAIAALASCYAPGIAGLAVLLVVLSGFVLTLAMLGSDARAWELPPLLLLGDVSYSLYMTHTLVQKVLYRAFPVADFSDRSTLIRVGVLAIYGLSIAGLCTVTYVFVERPCRRWGRSLVERLELSKSAPSLSVSGSAG